MQSGDFKRSWNTSEGEFGELLLANFLREIALVRRHRLIDHLNLSSQQQV